MIDPDPFGRLCRSAKGPVGVAVSGGSDSLALLYRAKAWSGVSGRPLLALTVDHRLRPEAAEEAGYVADICAGLGIAHQTLVWEAPVKRQDEARRARHRLLSTAVRAAGGTHLLLGHTEDDQCETVLMRFRQGSAWYGLAGMQEKALSPVWPEGAGLLLGRPLLGERRGTLQAELRALGVRWVEDPSNQDLSYERVRMRALLAEAPEVRRKILVVARRFRSLRVVEEVLIGRWLRDRLGLDAQSRLEADFSGLPPERTARALGLLLQAAAGRDRPARREGVMSLASEILGNASFPGATLGGAWVRRKRQHVTIEPEPALRGAAPTGIAAKSRLDAVKDLFLGQV